MGKFDGMDPHLVRDLLAETKRAAGELRRVEARVAQVMSGAGLATKTTHRPVQVADAADEMVRDVTARLGELEKRAEGPKSSLPVETDRSADEPQGTKRDPDDTPRTDDKPDAPTDKPDKPDAPTDKPDKPDKPDAGACDDDKPGVVDEPKDEDRGSRRDQGAEPERPEKPEQGIADTPAKDHPDDLDPSRPQVVVVDGVKVLQLPIDPPTAKELESLLENLDDVRPAEMPQVGDGQPAQTDRSSDADQAPRADRSDTPADDQRPPAGDGTGDCPDDGGGSRAVPERDTGVTDPGRDDAVPAPRDDNPPVVVPPTPPPDGSAGTQSVGAPTNDAAGGTAADGSSGGAAACDSEGGDGSNGADAYGVDGGTAADGFSGPPSYDARAWEDGGGGGVAAEARPVDPDALRTVAEPAGDIPPRTIPGAEVPPSEWDRGVWLPEDVGRHGSSGPADPGTPERSA